MSDQILGLISPGMMLVFTAGALMLWLRDRARVHLLGYVAGPVLLGISMALNHYSLVPDSYGMRLTSGAFSIASVIALVWAACHRIGQPAPVKVWTAGGLCTLGLIMFSDPAEDITAWLFAINGYCGIVFIMGAQLMALRRPDHLVDRVLIWVFAIIAVQFFIRPIAVVIASGPMTSLEYRESAGHAIYLVSAAILTLILTGSILATILLDHVQAVKNANRTDALSGLASRDAFEAEAGEFIEREAMGGRPISLIIADIDHFKQVNDLWGHLAGDQAIAGFGALITSTIRDTDRAGRVGGEEFCILVSNCDEEQAGRLAERLRAAFASLQHEGINNDIRLTASFGVARVDEGAGYTRTFALADRALYRAKEAGRNRVETAGSQSSKPASSGFTPTPSIGLAANS
ncbi:MAG: GGDEF domain-containing protein [Erythrobacter sp.]